MRTDELASSIFVGGASTFKSRVSQLKVPGQVPQRISEKQAERIAQMVQGIFKMQEIVDE